MHDDVINDTYNRLKNLSLFHSLEEGALKAMLQECCPVYWSKSETINSDIGSQYVHIIVSGRLKLTQIDPQTGRSVALFILHTGDIFDFFSLLDGKEHVVFPVALDAVEALSMPLERAREWICEHPEFNQEFLPYLGEKMRELESFSESLVFHDTATRIAKLILKHVIPKESGEHDHYPVKLIHNLSHESLSELIGSVRSVVSSQIHKLKEEEIIISKRGHLAVKNLEALMEKCDLFDYYHMYKK